MAEPLVMRILSQADTGGFVKATAGLKQVEKGMVDFRKNAKRSTTAAQQMRAGLAAAGLTAQRQTVPALKLTSRELATLEKNLSRVGLTLGATQRAFGITAQRANQMNRALTRSTAALGFISPTAATATQQLTDLFGTTGRATIIIGAAAVGAIALGTALFKSGKAAIAFESSFRGIRKTVSGTEEEFAALERANRDLAISLGSNVNEINAIGQAAGQLGIVVGDLARFEKIVIELASASDIGAKDAAFAFGGLIKILGLTIDELDSLTDQIVGLGNSFAATESEIVGFLNRIAGAGAVIGITASELASIATAFAALRIPTEAGGTAIQKVFLAMQKAAITGGKELRTFAAAVDLTGKEFKKLVEDDPAQAFVSFVNALSRQGARAQLTLEKLGLGNERTRRAFLTAAAAGGFLNEVIAQGAKDNEEGTARTEEFNRELETTAGQLRIASSAFNELAISIGDNLLPVIKIAAQLAVNLADALERAGKAGGFLLENLPIPRPEDNESDRIFLEGLKEAAESIGESLDFFGRLLSGQNPFVVDVEEAAQGVSALSNAFDIAADSARGLEGVLEDTLGLDAITDAAKDARKELSDLFKERTIEEARAEFALKSLRAERLALQTLPRALTSVEADRLKQIKLQEASGARIIEQEKTRLELAGLSLEISEGQLKTDAERTASVVGFVASLQQERREIEAIGDQTISFGVDLGETAFVIANLKGDILGPLTKEQHDILVRLQGGEQAEKDLKKILDITEFLDGREFRFSIAVDGIDAAIEGLNLVLRTADSAVVAAEAGFRIGLLEEQRPTIATKIIGEINRVVQVVNDVFAAFNEEADRVSIDAQGMADSMAKAAKEVDPLKDGIITLAEALEFGFTAATAATAELGFETNKLAARYFRVAVESIKLERAERRRQKQLEIGLRLAERNIEFQKELIELQIEEAVATAELANALRETGLESEIDTFALALGQLDEALRQAGESNIEFLQRLSDAATKAVQTQFEDLFRLPTREEAQLTKQLRDVELRRALLIRSGAPDEFIQAIDDEIQQIQNLLDVRRAEEAVVKAANDVANQGLLTQQEQFAQAQLLTGLLADESALLDELNLRLGLEILATVGVTDALDTFRAALVTAQEVISANTLGPGPGQSPGFAAGQPVTQQISFEVNVRAESIAEIRKQINDELDDQLNAAGLAGTNAGTGTFIP